MENQSNNQQDEKPVEIKTEAALAEEEMFEPIVRSKWQYVLIQVAFLAGGILLFVIINYIFGFMKGN